MVETRDKTHPLDELTRVLDDYSTLAPEKPPDAYHYSFSNALVRTGNEALAEAGRGTPVVMQARRYVRPIRHYLRPHFANKRNDEKVIQIGLDQLVGEGIYSCSQSTSVSDKIVDLGDRLLLNPLMLTLAAPLLHTVHDNWDVTLIGATAGLCVGLIGSAVHYKLNRLDPIRAAKQIDARIKAVRKLVQQGNYNACADKQHGGVSEPTYSGATMQTA